METQAWQTVSLDLCPWARIFFFLLVLYFLRQELQKSQQHRAAVICSTKYAYRLSILNLNAWGQKCFEFQVFSVCLLVCLLFRF